MSGVADITFPKVLPFAKRAALSKLGGTPVSSSAAIT